MIFLSIFFGLHFQSVCGLLTTICGDVLEVHLSRIYSSYDPALLKCMVNLEKIVISHTHIDAKQFVNGAVDCIQLRELHIAGCTQFTEQQMIELFCCLPNLEIIDATGNRGFQYANAYVVCSNLRKLKVFKIEAKYPFYERKDWRKIKGIFPGVDFGPKIQQIVDSVKN